MSAQKQGEEEKEGGETPQKPAENKNLLKYSESWDDLNHIVLPTTKMEGELDLNNEI